MTSALARKGAWLAIAVAALLTTELRLRGQDGPVSRVDSDVQALESHRAGYRFWRHIFVIPDGSIAYGSAQDGRLLAVIPTKGDWSGPGPGTDPAVADALAGVSLPSNADDRRARVVELLEPLVGSVLHNPTRGNFLLPNAERYGRFLKEWGAIYERFGVPAEIGLAQAIIESGLSGTRRSEARAIGFCQWLQKNWRQLNRLSPVVIEGYNQTTQAPYCAAYLTILATRYGSFIPALSDHHSGGVNVGRVLINGERLGGTSVRERYLLGSQLVRDLRRIDLYGYRDLYRTYGPRSFLYSEMVFGNMATVRALRQSTPQVSIYAMRTPRAVTLAEIARRTKLSTDEIRRFNPALTKRVPAHSDLYLPAYVRDLGRDVSFWHRPANEKYAAALADFLAIDAPPEHWDDGRLMPTLRAFERRFRDSGSEEGTVMATVLDYVMSDAESSGRREILAVFRDDEGLRELFNRALLQRVTSNLALLPCEPEPDREKGSC
jgi:hypothetical protein